MTGFTEKLLTPNKWSRSQREMIDVRGAVIHWYYNPGQSRDGCWGWHESKKWGTRGYGSAHWLVDERGAYLEVPTHEAAYHVGSKEYTELTESRLDLNIASPNYYLLGIEMAHYDMSGEPHPATLDLTLHLCRQLKNEYSLNVGDFYRHWDICGMQPHWTGIPCHRWYVEQPGEWHRFLDAIGAQRWI